MLSIFFCYPTLSWANTCRALMTINEAPQFEGGRYIDYKITFEDITPDEVAILAGLFDGTSILNRKTWNEFGLTEDRDRVATRTLKVRIRSSEQLETMLDIVNGYNSTRKNGLAAKIQKIAEDVEKYFTPVMQRLASHVENRRIAVETVLKMDEFSRGITKKMPLKITFQIHQREYTHSNPEDRNASLIAKLRLKADRYESLIWGKKGERHSLQIGFQVFTITLHETGQLDSLFRLLESGLSCKIEAL